MILLILFTSFIAFFVGRLYLKVRKLPPGPMPVPLFGNVFQLGYGIVCGKGLVGTMAEWKKTYGPVFTFWLGPFSTVNIADWTLAQESMVKKAGVFADRKNPYLFEITRNGLGILASNGDHWSEQRRFALTSLRNFGLGRNIMQDRIMMEVDYRFAKLDKSIEDGGGEFAMDPNLFLEITIGNIINRMLFTDRFTEEKEAKFFELKGKIDELVENASVLDLMIDKNTAELPLLKQRIVKMFVPQDALIAFIREQITNIKDEIASGKRELKGEGEDFVEAFLIQMEKNEKSGVKDSFFEDSLAITLFDLWLAGQETTATTLSWAICYLLQNPEWITKVQNELDTVTGSERSLAQSDKTNTPCLNAIITETLRLSTIVPMNLWRNTSEDTVVGNYVIPKGTAITAQLSLIMQDETTFKEPLVFDPSRYLGEDRLDQYVVSFGLGKRACPGESLARAELYLVLGNLLRRYSVDTVFGHLPKMESQSEKGTVRRPIHYKAMFKRRTQN